MAAATAPTTATTTWTKRHVIDSSALSRAEIETVLATARTFSEVLQRPVKKVPTLRGKVIVNMFYENSTRTRTSFELAAKYLSADTVNFSVSTSSEKKGESQVDTMESLLAMGVDAVVIRHSSAGFCHQMARLLGDRVCILNAGDGTHDHPTQGLLDLLTLTNHIPDIAGKKITIVGDVAHSRVARSNIHLLNKFGADVHVVGPTTLMPAGIGAMGCTVHDRIEPALEGADVVMCLRVQRERMKAGLLASVDEYVRFYGITRERLHTHCKPDVLVMHPGPMNRGVEIFSDVADDKTISLITQQVTSGVAVRMALLYLVLSAASSENLG